MNDHYLKFASQAAASAALSSAGLALEDTAYFIPDRVDIHVVGPIDGADFHVNLRGSLPESLAVYETFPATPRAVWA
jgi:hypothetical protein